MKSKILLILLFMLCGSSFRAHAEGGCPPGMIPHSGNDLSSCAPIPNYNQAAQPQGPRWASLWGAIATDATTGSLGAATGLGSKSSAEKAALADCAEKGGAACKLQIAYDNECAAMVLGDKSFNVTADSTREKAVQAGMKVCAAGDNHCRAYYTGCSFPEKIQ